MGLICVLGGGLISSLMKIVSALHLFWHSREVNTLVEGFVITLLLSAILEHVQVLQIG